MIKKTFYNLPDQKRQRIIKAITEEFASSDSEKISINRIVKTAKISRGSFYQYFDDKVDLVEVLTKSFIDLAAEETVKAVSVSQGDIFYVFEKLFDIIAEFARDETQKIILKNLIRNLKANDELVSEYLIKRSNLSEKIDEFTKLFSRENLKFQSDSDVENLTQILTMMLKNAIFNFFVMGKEYETAKKCYLHKLEIIKAGAIK